MQDHAQLIELIDKAAEVVGSDYKLAQMLEISRGAISDWRHDRRPCPPADVALMASIAGLDASAWLVRATIEKYEGTPKGDALYKALGKALLATGAAAVSAGANATAIFGNTVPDTVGAWLAAVATMYRKVKFLPAETRKGPEGLFFRL